MLAGVYSRVVESRNARFDAGRGVVTFDRPVISVGNLSLGGTGKTPMVQRIVGLLREHGHDPCIAMRGYGSRGAGGRSDEAELHRAVFDDLPVVAQPNRVEGLIKLFHTERGERVDAIVLDDGFQHRRIARQLDLVLIDASDDLSSGGVFPAGRLREPVANLARATHISITHAELVGPDTLKGVMDRAAVAAPGAAITVSEHRWSGLRIAGSDGESEAPGGWLAGKRIVAACALARPESFFAALGATGAQVAERFTLRDHDPFRPGTIARVVAAARRCGADAIVVTEKDWTKLSRGAGDTLPCPVARPILELVFREGGAGQLGIGGGGWEALSSAVLAVASAAPE